MTTSELLKKYEEEEKKAARKEKIRAYVVGTLIGIGLFLIVGKIDCFNWNNGICRRCHTKYEYVGSHYEGKRHDIKKYDYRCECNYEISFLTKF